jgi:hypothetical protein
MIQRIQSLYLLGIALLSIVFLWGDIINYSEVADSAIKLTFSTISRETEMQSSVMVQRVLPLSILIILIPLLSMFTIFIYKRRTIQLVLAKILVALISLYIIALAGYSFFIINNYEAEIILGFKMLIPLVQLICSYLAYRGIKKDDDLVKSYDRLR